MEKEKYYSSDMLLENFQENKMKTYKKLIVVALGFAIDAYDLFILNMILIILPFIYKSESSFYNPILATSVLVGNIIGQLIFGYLGDKFGRSKMFLVTCFWVCLFLVGCSFATALYGKVMFAYIWLIVCRLFLGIGMGGEYPLSATIAAETSIQIHRGRNMSLVFSSQGIGGLLGPVVLILFLTITKSPNVSWRLAVLFPVVPLLSTLYARFLLYKEEEEEKQREREYLIQYPEKTKIPYGLGLILKNYGKALFGTSFTWFIFDIIFYGNTIFLGTILSTVGNNDTTNEINYISNVGLKSMAVIVIGLPG
eukprot:TRINITY_DN3492_c0_g1_i1.p1 TRINITY_DN3492_c0_g1~~TRINITY_DN3492_c0_g1_i1.p1  ORF type:complete len:310 (-),score=44.64 TRINITY_DN3492_c0_g1_i1:476-1405(-)